MKRAVVRVDLETLKHHLFGKQKIEIKQVHFDIHQPDNIILLVDGEDLPDSCKTCPGAEVKEIDSNDLVTWGV